MSRFLTAHQHKQLLELGYTVPFCWFSGKYKTEDKNTDNTQTKHNPKESKQCKTQQNKTTLVQSPFTTLIQETIDWLIDWAWFNVCTNTIKVIRPTVFTGNEEGLFYNTTKPTRGPETWDLSCQFCTSDLPDLSWDNGQLLTLNVGEINSRCDTTSTHTYSHWFTNWSAETDEPATVQCAWWHRHSDSQ